MAGAEAASSTEVTSTSVTEVTEVIPVFESLIRKIQEFKENIHAIGHLKQEKLPEPTEEELATMDKNPLYTWINLRKINQHEVVAALVNLGLTRTLFEDDTLIQKTCFAVDKQHPNLIRFNSHQAERIRSSKLAQEGKLVIQDKAACIAVYALVKAICYKTALTGTTFLPNLYCPQKYESPAAFRSGFDKTKNAYEWYEGIFDLSGNCAKRRESVVVTHCGSARSAAHLASLLVEAVPKYISKSGYITVDGDLCKSLRENFISLPPLTVMVFGVPDDREREITRIFRKRLGLGNFKLYTDEFTSLDFHDERLEDFTAILVNPPSSGSALKDPAAAVSHEDEKGFPEQCDFFPSMINNESFRQFTVTEQTKALRLALSLPNVKLTLYTTCSTMQCENYDVFRTCLTEARSREDIRRTQILDFIVRKELPLKDYLASSFELVDLSQVMVGYPTTSFQGSFIDMPPSTASSGVFAGLIRRRDQLINLGRDPVRSFIASQLAIAPKNQETKPMTMTNMAASGFETTIVGPRTEEEWTEFILKKYYLSIDTTGIQADIDHLSKPEVAQSTVSKMIGDTINNAKRRVSKRDIFKRISAPTCASLAKKTEKWTPPGLSHGNTSGKPSKSGTLPIIASERKPYGITPF